MRAAKACGLLLVLIAPLAWAGRAADPLSQQADQLASQALRSARTPEGAAALLELYALEDSLADVTPLVQTFAMVAGRRSSDPLLRSLARQLLLDVERARGRMPRARAVSEELGWIDRFYVTGPFDNEGKGGCDRNFGPEGPLDLAARFPAVGGRETGWHALSLPEGTVAFDGYTDLGAALPRTRESVGYALTFLEAPSDNTVATLALGTSGAHRLFLNGQQVAAEDRYGAPRPDQARYQVKLRKGPNALLLKVCQEAGEFGFYLRKEDAPQVSVTLPDTLPELAAGGPAPAAKVLPTLTRTLEQAVARRPNDAELRGAYARVLDFRRDFEERLNVAREEAERAAREAPTDVSLQLLAAGLHREDLNERRRLLHAALKVAPEDARVRLAIADLELLRDHPERALPHVEGVLAATPLHTGARLLQLRAHEALGEPARASVLLEEALRSSPRSPALLREAVRWSQRHDRPNEAISRARVVLAFRFNERTVRLQLARLLADQARIEEAAKELRTVLSLSPWDNTTRVRLAELLVANARAEEGLAVFADARRIAPDEPDLYEREGRALLLAGKRDEGVTSLARALALKPQNPRLRELLRALQGDTGKLGPDAIDALALLPEAEKYKDEDAVFLVDATHVRVQHSGLSSRSTQLAVKVLTQRGVDSFRSFPISYAPSRQEVRVLRARVTKPDGSVIDGASEGERNLNEPWTGMYYDARARVLSFPQLAPGDLLEVQFRLEDVAQDNLLSDYWGDVESFQSTYPKLRYRYTVDMPKERPLYWNSAKDLGLTATKDTSEAGRVRYGWEARHVAKLVPEPMMPGWAEVSKTLHVSTYKSWDDVGRYYWGLVRDQLTPNAEIRAATEQALEGVDVKDEAAVVRAIYSFVVTNTRYVALEFGIHSFKPYRVDRVLARRFGDCKDKASLIHSMLQVAGVDSRLVLLRMRNLGELGGEVASLAAFNHAILYVPKLDLYLDGTAEFHGARELPSADRVANVLIVEPNGSSPFRTTPEAKAEDNLSVTQFDVALARDGSASVIGRSSVHGQSAPEYRRAYRAQASRRSVFEQGWGQLYPGLNVKKVELNDTTRLEDAVAIDFEMSVPRFSEVGPTMLRFHPFGSARAYTQNFASLAKRQWDLVLNGPWKQDLRYSFTLPAGYAARALPAEFREETKYGKAALGCRAEEQRILCEGSVELSVGRVKASEYPDFRAFLGRVDQAFARKLTIEATGAGEQAAR